MAAQAQLVGTYQLPNNEADFKAYISRLGARFLPAESSQAAHIYWVPSLGQWLKVSRDRRTGEFKLGFFRGSCPCGLSAL